ncbi:TnsA-like heteromeric transposase endonuclease subunit [Streptomyces nanhaiensis]|uniref:TnsA-like heteromeric transposase endonuclease subunit n=1 Tax=Streptomyces nanhaiensis TaxID=679319 RepID=UPI00399D4667
MEDSLPQVASAGGVVRAEARFVGGDGRLRRVPWSRLAREVAVEDLPPVRTFSVRQGRRVAPGWWWSATTGRLVHYGFGAMRTQVMLLDRDPRVVALACSPVELAWLAQDGEAVVHAPHLMARLEDGSGVLVDCAGRQGPSRRVAERAPQLTVLAREAGWRYRVAALPSPVGAANVRWLAGYRHPRNGGGRLGEVAAAFARPRPLEEGVRDLGDPAAVWPAVFHALWCGILRTALERPLHQRSVATADAAGAVAA